VCKKVTIHLIFDHNLGNINILSLSDFQGNFVYTHYQDSPPYLNCFYTSLPSETWKISIAADFNGVLYVRPRNSSCKI